MSSIFPIICTIMATLITIGIIYIFHCKNKKKEALLAEKRAIEKKEREQRFLEDRKKKQAAVIAASVFAVIPNLRNNVEIDLPDSWADFGYDLDAGMFMGESLADISERWILDWIIANSDSSFMDDLMKDTNQFFSMHSDDFSFTDRFSDMSDSFYSNSFDDSTSSSFDRDW